MKLWDNALNGLSEEMIEENLKEEAEGRRIPSSDSVYSARHWIKWIVLSAAALSLVAGLSTLPAWIERRAAVPTDTEQNPPASTALALGTTFVEELALEKQYQTRITGGDYQTYVLQRTCEEQYVGELLGSVTVEAGWQNGAGEYVSEVEHLMAQVYALKAYSPQAAVCLKFLDKGDALTTEHYYVYRNPASSIDLHSLGVGLGWWNVMTMPEPGEDGTVTGYSEGYMPAATTGTEGGE